MNVIILAGSDADVRRWHDAHPDVTIAAEASPDIRKGWDKLLFRARIVRLDSWQYDERVVSALRTADAQYGLIDPTGLLGGSRYGDERNLLDTTPVPIGAGAEGVKIRAMREQRRQQRRAANLNPGGDGEDRTWR